MTLKNNKTIKKTPLLSSKTWRSGSEFLGGIITGLILGWFLDAFFGIEPWGLLGGLLLGITTGFWNIYRLYQEILNHTEPRKEKSP